MLPVIILSVAASVAGSSLAAENQRRIAAGLPPLIRPAQSDKERQQIERESRHADFMFWTWIAIGGVIFTAPFAAMIFAFLKIMFAKEGIDWP